MGLGEQGQARGDGCYRGVIFLGFWGVESGDGEQRRADTSTFLTCLWCCLDVRCWPAATILSPTKLRWSTGGCNLCGDGGMYCGMYLLSSFYCCTVLYCTYYSCNIACMMFCVLSLFNSIPNSQSLLSLLPSPFAVPLLSTTSPPHRRAASTNYYNLQPHAYVHTPTRPYAFRPAALAYYNKLLLLLHANPAR